MKRSLIILISTALCALVSPAQEVGTGADMPSFSLQLSYEHLSRDFNLSGLKEDIGRNLFRATVGVRPGRDLRLFAFVGSSNFPNSFVPDRRHFNFGGGLKYALMRGEIDVADEDGRHLNIQGAVTVDLQVSRLQSSDNGLYENFGLTEYQGALDFGCKIMSFAGYLGFKFSKISGSFTQLMGREVDTDGNGLFSLILGFNYHIGKRLALVSEFSFFTESSWAFGLRWDLGRN